MTARNGETSRRRGKARDDKEVLAEAHAPPAAARRGQVYATGEAREGRDVFRTTRFYGMVFVTIAEQYVDSHAPVPCDACKEAVYKHSEAGRDHKNPFAILAQLEKPGLLQVDRHRLPVNHGYPSDLLPPAATVIESFCSANVLVAVRRYCSSRTHSLNQRVYLVPRSPFDEIATLRRSQITP